MLKKPPIGLIPKNNHDDARFLDVCGAITRYYDANLPIPIEWVKEYNDHLEPKDTVVVKSDYNRDPITGSKVFH